MQRLWRFAAALTAFVALGSPVPPSPLRPYSGAGPIAYTAVPVVLDPRDPERRQLGPLRFIAGWALSSPDRRLGGISAIHVEGAEVLALSDAGDLLRFPAPRPDPSGFSLEAAGHAQVWQVREGPGSPERKLNRDTEAMALAGGEVWIAFEHHNQVWRYRRSDWLALGRAAPAAMQDWPSTRGAEAMTRLPDGRFLVMSERRQAGASPALLFPGDPAAPGTRAIPLRFAPPDDYRITDVAALPDGRLLLVTRRMSWTLDFSTKLLVGRLPGRAGEEIAWQEIATIEPPLTSDNFEAVSVTQEAGQTIIWLATDDNTTPLQRTLLLKFAWEEGAP